MDFLKELQTPTAKKYPNINIFADEAEDTTTNIFSSAEVIQEEPGQSNQSSNSSFYQAETRTEPQNSEKQIIQESVKPPANPELSAEITINSIDGLQQILFFGLNKRKTIKKVFGNKEKYKAAENLNINDSDLTDDEKKEVAKIDKYINILEKKQEKIPFRPDEKLMLQGPLKTYMETKNLDIPPGLAIALAMTAIFLPRVFDTLD